MGEVGMRRRLLWLAVESFADCFELEQGLAVARPVHRFF